MKSRPVRAAELKQEYHRYSTALEGMVGETSLAHLPCSLFVCWLAQGRELYRLTHFRAATSFPWKSRQVASVGDVG